MTLQIRWIRHPDWETLKVLWQEKMKGPQWRRSLTLEHRITTSSPSWIMVLEVLSQGKTKSNTRPAPNSSRGRDIRRCSLDTCSMLLRTLMLSSIKIRCRTQPNIRKCPVSKEPLHRATLSLGDKAEQMNQPPTPKWKWTSKESSFCPIYKAVLQTML